MCQIDTFSREPDFVFVVKFIENSFAKKFTQTQPDLWNFAYIILIQGYIVS